MIKFRAWDKEEKEWLNIRTIGFDDDGSLWYLQAWDDNENDIEPPYFSDDLGVKWELIQSTGLKDKNGTEIYEGDIIQHSEKPNPVFKYPFEVVQFKTGEWRLDNFIGGTVLAYCNQDELEVIGNIFQNSELLEADSHER